MSEQTQRTKLPKHPRINPNSFFNAKCRAEAYNRLIFMMESMTEVLVMGFDILGLKKIKEGEQYLVVYQEENPTDSYWVGIDWGGHWYSCFESGSVKSLILESIDSDNILAKDDAVYCEARLDYSSLVNVFEAIKSKLPDNLVNQIIDKFEMATF